MGMPPEYTREENCNIKGCAIGCLLMIIIPIVIFSIASFFTECKATNNDIDVSSSNSGFYIIIEPEDDISNLKIKVVIRDRDGVIIDRFTKKLGDVKEGEKYRVAFNDYTSLLTDWEYKVEVTGGWKWP